MKKKSDQIRKEISLKRKQLVKFGGFGQYPMRDLLFKEISELNGKLSVELDRENAAKRELYIAGEKSQDEDAKEIDDKQRYRDIKSEIES